MHNEEVCSVLEELVVQRSVFFLSCGVIIFTIELLLMRSSTYTACASTSDRENQIVPKNFYILLVDLAGAVVFSPSPILRNTPARRRVRDAFNPLAVSFTSHNIQENI